MENFDTHLGPVLVSVSHAAHIYLKRGKKFIAQNKRQNEEVIFFKEKWQNEMICVADMRYGCACKILLFNSKAQSRQYSIHKSNCCGAQFSIESTSYLSNPIADKITIWPT